jgi:hypothetical protein
VDNQILTGLESVQLDIANSDSIHNTFETDMQKKPAVKDLTRDALANTTGQDYG